MFCQGESTSSNLIVKHVPSIDQVADILPIAISSSRFYELRNKLRVQPLAHSGV